jgi:primosomal protein N' (replication factor Y)
MFYVNVLPLRSVDRALTYTAPQPLQVGMLVRIRVRGRQTVGLVAKVLNIAPEADYALVPIEGSLYETPVVYEDNLALIQRVADYYVCPLGTVLETALPAFLRVGKAFKKEFFLHITDVTATFPSRALQQAAMYRWIEQHPFVSEAEFRKNFPKGTPFLKRLIEKNYVERCEQPPSANQSNDTLLSLTDEQEEVFEKLRAALRAGKFSAHLLFGVTGSGKTELYHALTAEAKNLGLQTLYLVPEILLSAQALAKIKIRLSAYGIRVGLWHSRLSDGERMRVRQGALSGTIDVILGTRSAVFLPFKYLGLVVVDEEHEPSYKQSETPRYHGRDLALYRARLNNALCVLGSATPSVESWNEARCGHYALHTLAQRPLGQPLPKVFLADMRYEKPNFEGSFVLSALLREKLSLCLDRGEQALLFLNRRGYAPYYYCPKCRVRLECPNCRSYLVFHKTDATLRCHICDTRVTAYDRCPACNSPMKLSVGLGTQRIEACLKQLYKRARILRLDSDAASKANDWYEAVLERKYDILIGTQMVAKGLDFPHLTLVGVIQADLITAAEDFRSSERLFQLLVQVSGRAGRAERPGEVVLQTFSPEADCVRYALQHDTVGFLDRETALRKQHRYPPFRRMVRHLFRSFSEKTLRYVVEQWNDFLRKNVSEDVEIMGPAVPYINKAHRYWRMHLLYLTSYETFFLPQLQNLRQRFQMPSNVIDILDVDPTDFR